MIARLLNYSATNAYKLIMVIIMKVDVAVRLCFVECEFVNVVTKIVLRSAEVHEVLLYKHKFSR